MYKNKVFQPLFNKICSKSVSLFPFFSKQCDLNFKTLLVFYPVKYSTNDKVKIGLEKLVILSFLIKQKENHLQIFILHDNSRCFNETT